MALPKICDPHHPKSYTTRITYSLPRHQVTKSFLFVCIVNTQQPEVLQEAAFNRDGDLLKNTTKALFCFSDIPS